MKKILFTITGLLAALPIFATNYTISISGTKYSPASLTVKVGDQITISASSFHPLVQVDENSWTNLDATPVDGGWGVKTANYTFTAAQVGTIYFVCQAHVSLGMRGTITVEAATSVDENLSRKNQLFVFPNPAVSATSFTFTSSDNTILTARIYDITGQVKQEILTNFIIHKGTFTQPFEVAELPAGMYFLVLNVPQQKYVYRFLVNR